MADEVQAKLTKTEMAQVLLRAADKVLEEYADDDKLDMQEITDIIQFTVAEVLKEKAD